MVYLEKIIQAHRAKLTKDYEDKMKAEHVKVVTDGHSHCNEFFKEYDQWFETNTIGYKSVFINEYLYFCKR
jgi:hypothetical protein